MNLPICDDPLPEPDDLATTSQACRLLGVSLRSVYRWIQQGQVRAWKVMGRLRLSRGELLGMARPVRSSRLPDRPTPRRREAEKRRAEEEARRLGLLR